MKTLFIFFFLLSFVSVSHAQKDSLQLGSRYADDQIYASISYAQLRSQPTSITKSNFSYSLSFGFIKDFILNKQGTISVAGGVGYGFDSFNHKLKVQEVNNATLFTVDNTISGNLLNSHNFEFPLELRWRTSTINKYDFWRIYAGVKILYNFSNTFKFTDASNNFFKYTNISNYNNVQYGLTLSAGYDEFNVNIFYGLSPIFKNSTLNGENINTKMLKFGLIFYFL